MTDPGTGESFVAGPTSRNEVGNTKRAAAKATGNMSASKKIDPDLTMEGVEGDRPKSGSKAAIHGFKDVGARMARPSSARRAPTPRSRTRR